MIQICCCGPSVFEGKQLGLVAPFPGYGKFISSIGETETGYVTRKYLVYELLDTDKDNLTQLTRTTYDPDSGAVYNEVFTDSGFSGVGGTVTADVLVSDTHVYRTWEQPFPPFDTSRRDQYLATPLDLDDVHTTWRTRWNAVVANNAMKASFNVTGIHPTAGEITVAIRFPSELGEVSDPPTEFAWITLKPTVTYPWDGKYKFEDASRDGPTLLNAGNFNPKNNISSSPAPEATYDGTAENFYFPSNEAIGFQKQIFSLPDGLGCHLEDTFPNIRGVMVYSLDPDTVTSGKNYFAAETNLELHLSPGWFVFDGVSVTPIGGSILSTLPTLPEFGIMYRTRTDTSGTLGYTDEWCPP